VGRHHLPPFSGQGGVEERAEVAVREAGVVFDLAREGELAERERARHPVFLGDRAFEDQRLELGPGGVGGG
jgi:hypothetical protein